MSKPNQRIIPLNTEIRSILERRRFVKELRAGLNVAAKSLRELEAEAAELLDLHTGTAALLEERSRGR